jgi:hypothetical protein
LRLKFFLLALKADQKIRRNESFAASDGKEKAEKKKNGLARFHGKEIPGRRSSKLFLF